MLISHLYPEPPGRVTGSDEGIYNGRFVCLCVVNKQIAFLPLRCLGIILVS